MGKGEVKKSEKMRIRTVGKGWEGEVGRVRSGTRGSR